MPDNTFEKTFGDLAHAHLVDKAPGLVDYLIGFQIIDKTDDDTRGVGVFGFRVADQWMYAPVFFMNGEIKGHELLYLKKQDAFVPMQENWVNYLVGRKPHILGESTPREDIKALRSPDFNIFSDSPNTTKYASVKSNHSFKAIYKRIADKYKSAMHMFLASPNDKKFEKIAERFDLRNVVKTMGKAASVSLAKTMKSNIKFAEALLQFYNINDILNSHEKTAAEKALDGFFKSSEELEAGDKAVGTEGGFKVVLEGDNIDGLNLNDTEKEILKRDGVYIVDNRKNTSTVFQSQVNKTISGPDCPGLYMMLTRSGDLMPVYVFRQATESTSSDRLGPAVTVVNRNNKEFGSFLSKDILVKSDSDPKEGWDSDFSGLTAPGSADARDTVLFVNDKMKATAPYYIEKKVTGTNNNTTYWVNRASYSPEKINPQEHYEDRAYTHRLEVAVPMECVRKITITDVEDGQLTRVGDTIYVPGNYKAMKVKVYDPYESERRKDYGSYRPENKQRLEPCSYQDLHNNLLKQGGLSHLKVNTDGIEYFVTLDGKMSQPMSKLSAVVTLAKEYNIKADLAKHIVKSATNGGRTGQARYLIKLAQGLTPPIPERPMTFDPELGVGMTEPYDTDQEIPALKPYPDARQFYDTPDLPKEVQDQAIQAAQSGQKEVLDTSVLSGLVNTSGVDSVVDQYLADLMQGLDRVGRILFMFYWHNDKFKERYGKQDLPELEDSLRDVFKSLGELTLFLKQKTIEPDPQAAEGEIELDEVM